MPAGSDGGRITELVVVHTRPEAEMLVATLRAQGLRAMASADDAGGWGPNVGIEGVRVLVLEDDLEAARRILDDAGPEARRPRPRKRRRPADPGPS